MQNRALPYILTVPALLFAALVIFFPVWDLIQISLHDNYAQLQADTGLPVLSDPDILARDRDAAALSALWYWRKNVTDGGSISQVTRQINGPAMDGLIARKTRYEAALRVK